MPFCDHGAKGPKEKGEGWLVQEIVDLHMKEISNQTQK